MLPLFLGQDQYFFIHEAVAEAILCGQTEVKVHDLATYMEELHKPNNDTTRIDVEFKVNCVAIVTVRTLQSPPPHYLLLDTTHTPHCPSHTDHGCLPVLSCYCVDPHCCGVPRPGSIMIYPPPPPYSGC